MSRLGKCNNYSGCLLAYRGEETNVPDGQPFMCAECGKPLTEVKAPAGKWIMYAGGGVAAIVVLAVVATVVPKLLSSKKHSATPTAQTTPEPAATSTTTETPPATTTETPPAPPANPAKVGDAEPPATVKVEPKVNLTIDQNVKAQVLERIDRMPTLSQTEKDKLYNAVERARKMGLAITVPFPKGKTTPAPGDLLALKDALERPEIASLRADPLATLVVLGYADPKGDQKANLQYSKDRADAVAAAIRKEVGDKNLVRSVAMGGSTLLDAQNMEKNRIAEVWVVLP